MSDNIEHSYDALFAAAILIVIVGGATLWILSGVLPSVGYTYDDYLEELEQQGVTDQERSELRAAAARQAASYGSTISTIILISLLISIVIFWVTLSKA